MLMQLKDFLINSELQLLSYKENKDIYILGDNNKLFRDID
jgi:hypothetical protein